MLFESGFYRRADMIVLVKVPSKGWNKRVNFLKNREFVRKAVKFQKIFGLNKKIALSDYILYNDKNKAALRRFAVNLFKKTKEIHGHN